MSNIPKSWDIYQPLDFAPDMDVGQNGRPLRGPQMEMSSLLLTIQLLGYLILTHTHISAQKRGQGRETDVKFCDRDCKNEFF